MKITINEPCHENWDAMTPNDKGAFCKSCAKDVVDFSKMGIAEIKSFFSKPQGKVCGRFEEKQLQELTFDDFFAKFTYWNFSKKFAAIFFMAFGFWIFSNSNAMGQFDNHMMKGEVAYVPEKRLKVKHEPVKTVEPTTCDKKIMMGKVRATRIEEKNEPLIMGDVEPIRETPVKEEPKNEEPMIMGGISPVQLETKNPEPTIKGNAVVMNTDKEIVPICTIVKTPVETTSDPYILGQAVVKEEINKEEVIKTKETTKTEPVLKIDSVTTATEKIETNIHEMIIYPNPSNGNFTIETEVNTKQIVSMYDENGKLVLIQSITGTSTINASGLNNGIYNILITGGPKEGLLKKKVAIVK